MKSAILATTCFVDRPGLPSGLAERRAANFARCHGSWARYIDFGFDYFIVADDGSDERLLRGLRLDKGLALQTEVVEAPDGNRTGLGASLNRAIEHMRERKVDWHFYAHDDWLATETVSLDGPIELLFSRGYGCVRLGPPHPNVRGEFRLSAHGWYLDCDTGHGGFVYGQRPAIYRNEVMWDIMPPFASYLSPLEVERIYNDQWCEKNIPTAYWIGPTAWTPLNGPDEELGDWAI